MKNNNGSVVCDACGHGITEDEIIVETAIGGHVHKECDDADNGGIKWFIDGAEVSNG